MIINSKFHDYYDTALAHGVDKTCVFDRGDKSLAVPSEIFSLPYRFHRRSGQYSVAGFWIGFCGKVYYGERHVTSWTKLGLSDKTTVIYGEGELPRQRDIGVWGGLSIERHNEVVAKDYTKTFLRLDVPYFVYECGRGKNACFRVCPRLADYEFYKVFDSFSANQEIQQFLTNELARDKMMPEPKTTDEYKVRAHGMDTVASFRRSKGGPTRKRKKSQ